MAKLIAIVGGLVICLGIDLLWQSRNQIRYWVETFAHFLSALWQRQLPARVFSSASEFLRRQGAVQVLLGLSFALVIGPVLLVVSLTLMLYRQ